MDRRLPSREQLERWLASEAASRSDDAADEAGDEAADAAFAHLFAAMPRIEPRAAFAEQTMTAVLRWRTRRRRLIAFAWAATLGTMVSGLIAAWLLGPSIAPAAVKPLALGLSRATPWLVAYATEAMNLWWAIAGVATAIANALATPPRAGALVAAELVGILAFFALQRLVAAEHAGEMEI
jgi:hypothetical protein